MPFQSWNKKLWVFSWNAEHSEPIKSSFQQAIVRISILLPQIYHHGKVPSPNTSQKCKNVICLQDFPTGFSFNSQIISTAAVPKALIPVFQLRFPHFKICWILHNVLLSAPWARSKHILFPSSLPPGLVASFYRLVNIVSPFGFLHRPEFISSQHLLEEIHFREKDKKKISFS